MIESVPVNTPLLAGNERKYLMECLNTGWISSEGPFVERFENAMAKSVNRRFGVAVSSGTAALELAVAALKLSNGDEIIMPTFTIISCSQAAVRRGCTPVLVDCDPYSWNMDIHQIEEKITEHTKAIMVVHIYGLPTDMTPVLKLADRHGLMIIEDAAEMHGQTCRGVPCGGFGDISVFSFYPNKHVTTGEGGMVLMDDEALADRCKELRNLCFRPDKRFVHDELGYNFRMTNLQAAIGLAQVERLEEHVERKREMGRYYYEKLSDIHGLRLPLVSTDYAENIFWVYGIVLGDEHPFDAVEAAKRLKEKGIGTRPFFWCMHEQPVFQKMGLFKSERYPVSERLARRGFYIPSGLSLTRDQMDRVVVAMHEVFK